MGVISLTLPSDGDTIDAADVNTPFNTIQTLVNGNLDASNLASNAVTTVKITDANVTPAKWTNPYKFRASRNAAASTGNGAFAVVAFDTEQFDSNNNLSAGVYTVPVTGFYMFTWMINATVSAGADEDFVASLFVGGVENSRGTEMTTRSTNSSGNSCLISLTATNTVDIRVFNTTSRSLNVGSTYANYFSGYLVSIT